MKFFVSFIYIFCLLIISISATKAQSGNYSNTSQLGSLSYDSQGRLMKTPKKDSLQHRDANADSITIFYQPHDSTSLYKLDSTINDISTRFPLLYQHINLGNYGSADKSLLFKPNLKSGWDAGMHQFDVYKFSLENTRFYQTTRPYTEMAYLLGSKAEQFVNIIHTQNRNPRFNFGIEYRFSNMPGLYRMQNNSHNNFRFTSHYQSKRRRYELFTVFISNKHAVSENGGVREPGKLDSLALGDPYEVETRLGSASAFSRNPFNTTIKTGNTYKETYFLLKHQYDFGQKDSLVKDSVVIHLFYPRFRLQHQLHLGLYSFNYNDVNADSTLYSNYFNYRLNKNYDTLNFKDKWSVVTNEFNVISFPQKTNQAQFLKTGIGIQLLKGTFGNVNTNSQNLYNIFVQGEYRNRTKNNVWDMLAKGQLYLNGFNGGDYEAYVSLQRSLSNKIGSLQIGFQNTNRTPSFIFDATTNFPVKSAGNFGKENITRVWGIFNAPKANFTIGGNYYLVSNYAYFDSFFTAKQTSSLFNVLQIHAEKKFKLSKHWNWYAALDFQQTDNKGPINLPHVVTRQRLAFEGNFYTNLFLSTGIEVRYYSSYNADNYSPFTGQFFYQNNQTISNRPDINLFFNFRIKTFKGFIRLENLNTINFKTGAFNKYNFAAPYYPQQGQWFRLGIWWTFIN